MTDNAKAAVVWLLISVCWLTLILLLWGLDITPAAADDDSGFDYSEQIHQGAVVPADGLDGCVVAELEAGCVPIPAAMFINVRRVAECESKWNSAAVGKLGERGMLQLHPVHAAPMAKAGLDWRNSEIDRWRWSVRIWEGHGWRSWSCRP